MDGLAHVAIGYGAFVAQFLLGEEKLLGLWIAIGVLATLSVLVVWNMLTNGGSIPFQIALLFTMTAAGVHGFTLRKSLHK